MDKTEIKIAKKIAAILKKQHKVKMNVIVNKVDDGHDVLVVDVKNGCYCLNVVRDKAVATTYCKTNEKVFPQVLREVLYNFFIK